MTIPPPLETDVPCEEVPGIRRLPARDFSVCVGVSLAFGVVFHAAVNPYPGPGVAEWLRSLLFNTMIAVSIGTTLSVAYCFLFPALIRRGMAVWLAHVLVTPAAVAAGAEVAVRSIEWLGGPEASLVRPNALRIGLAFGAIGVTAYFVYDQLRSRARRVELRAEQAQRDALLTQLKSLQARTNPHFLFNSLNTVAGLIEEEPRKAERVLEQLASLYRYCLKGSNAEWVRLEEELAATRDYLQVEEVRLGSRLHASLDVETGAETVLVPPLLLQPLVENAILHGIADRKEGGRVAVRISRSHSDLVMTVVDDGPGPGNSRHQGSGTSLADLGQRLRLIYGDRASLDAGGADEGGFRIEIRIPVEHPL
jgi:two-component system, LytTR family, sensor histidine kinase AlgZ